MVHVQIVSAQIVSGTNCIGTNCIGTICIGTICIGHKLYRVQTVSDTNCIGHKLYRAQIVSCNHFYPVFRIRIHIPQLSAYGSVCLCAKVHGGRRDQNKCGGECMYCTVHYSWLLISESTVRRIMPRIPSLRVTEEEEGGTPFILSSSSGTTPRRKKQPQSLCAEGEEFLFFSRSLNRKACRRR